ncbi:MAG TPA: four helix bundle protein [Terracidiphilus sp.]
MSRPKSYRELIVWQKAMALARQAYVISEALPKRETYGLVNQIRRAAVSIASNIAEGYGRLTDTQFRHFLGNARGSLYEMQTQIELAADLGYLDKEGKNQLMEQGSEVARLVNGLLASLRSAANNSSPATNAANSASPASSANAHVS